MKIISSIKKTAIIAALVLGAVSCGDDDNPIPVPELSITEIAIADTELTSLVAALQAADLVSVLEGDGPFTVLAPSNEAFAAFLQANNWADLSEVPAEALRQTLLNHVIAGDIKSTDLADAGGYANTESTAGPDGAKLSLYYSKTDGVSFNGISKVTTADIAATNGTIHKVDAVISLPNLTTFVAADPNFSTLLTVLGDADLVDTVAGLETATIFAPNDAAFAALTDVPTGDDLVTVLQQHVVNGANAVSSSLTDGMMVSPLAGGDITINLPGNDGNPAKLTDGAGNADIDVIFPDVQATNGVIHVIESVLLPAM